MTESSPSILITGANGFVGSRLCRLFGDQGYRVIAGVRRTADLSLLERLDLEYRYGDLSSTEILRPMVADCDYIIHNAGIVKAKRKQTFFDINEQGTAHLMNAIVQRNPDVKKVIYISSLAAAGPSENDKPVKESDPPRPITTYGVSKLAGERVALGFTDRLHVIALRPPGIYGPGDKEMFSFFDTINKGIKPLIGNPNRHIQLVQVDDLCRAALKAIEGDSVSGEPYFIAENRSYAMANLVEILAAACGKKTYRLRIPASIFKVIAAFSEFSFKLVGATPMLTREKAGELLASWIVSTDKAREHFGFESEIDFAIGARQTYDWYRREGWLK